VSTFVDTSALLALLDGDDQNHPSAAAAWTKFITAGAKLVCTNYILVEAFALVQNRLGMDAVRTLHDDLIPLLQIEWIDAVHHARSVAALLIAGRRQLSLVDCTSFEVMRSSGIDEVFAFDRHFAEQGFLCLPLAAI
jgi:predicted nucleic acid-binding protein